MSFEANIKTEYGDEIEIWVAVHQVVIQILGNRRASYNPLAYLTAAQVDELIRVLAAARVEISKERPL